ncbi:MAG: hypothetical protein ABI540_05550 [Spartobacteria bacterium]
MKLFTAVPSLVLRALILISLLPTAAVAAETSTSRSATDQASDPGWPREHVRDGARLIVYQPQVDDWKNFEDLTWRMAVSLTPAGGKPEIGVVEMKGKTEVDNENKVVLITDPQITATHFPPGSAENADELMRQFVPPTITISLHRLVASMPKSDSVSGVQLKNDPPTIFVAYRPSILLSVDGEPVLSEVPKTDLKFVVNTQWPLFFDGTGYYAPVGQQWLTASKLDGEWSATRKLPAGMSTVAQGKEWEGLDKIVPPPAKSGQVVPAVFYSDKPAEIILFDGQPAYAKIPETQLAYATNTNSVVFQYAPTHEVYYLASGRWFKAGDLKGPWTYATPDLPADFAKIPLSSPASAILSSVPGTDEAKDAVLLAQVPTTLTVNPTEAAAEAKVEYGGEPNFEPITGTSMAYATNTEDKVIKVGDVYYLCLQAVWFMSPNPKGPWTTATSVPQEIYKIPPSSPVYNVTYVTQSATTDGTIQSSYTAGYLGAFILGAATGAIIANNSGYYYPPYIYRPPYGYPAYYPYARPYGGSYYGAAHYNSATGTYGWSQTVKGPYGSATRGAAYNPYTGTYARGATASTPYGSRSVGQAYNPYTGRYAATSQGTSPGAQWGSSVVSNGNRSAYTQHYSTAQGTVASAQGSKGGKAVGTSNAWGNAAAGKTASGNMYAGRDGNAYKNTGSGWEKYDNGSWNSVDKPNWQQAQGSQQRTQGSEQQAQSNQQRNQGSGQQAQSSQQRNQGSGQQAQSSQQRNQAAQQRTRSEGSSSRSEGGWASQKENLQRESQNRQRGGMESQRFQSQRSGGEGWGGRGGGRRR